MSGLLFLTSQDFHIQQGTKGSILCHNIPGFTLVLFYSNQCPHCKQLIPIFKRLPGTIGGCQFGMVNVSTNRACIKESKNTIAPISYVPYIILYISGKPYMSYSGPHEASELRRFVVEVANKLKQKQQFTDEKKVRQPKGGIGIPEYSIGQPLFGDDMDVTYLDFDEAYETK